MRKKFIYLIKCLLISAFFILFAKIGLSIKFVHSSVSLFWLPSGFSIACLLLLGRKYWLGVSLGAFLANFTTETPIGFVIAATISNTIEPISALYILTNFFSFDKTLSKLRDLVLFLIFAVLLSPIFSALLGVLALCFTGILNWENFFSATFGWWAGDAFGILTLGILILVWSTKPKTTINAKRLIEGLIISLILIAIQFTTYFDLLPNLPFKYLTWLIFPLLVWISIRFSLRDSVTISFILISISVLGTIFEQGPFYSGEMNKSLVLLYSFVSIVMINSMILASLTEEKTLKEQKIESLYNERNALFNITEDFIWSIDRNFNLIFGNTAFLKRIKKSTGVDIKIGEGVLTLPKYPEAAISFWKSNYLKVFSGESIRMETLGNPLDTNSWVEINLEPIRKGEAIIGVACFGKDISERIIANESIKKSEEQLRLAINGGDLGLWDWNFVTGEINVNDRWITMLGFTREEISTTIEFWSSRVHPDDVYKLEKIIEDDILYPSGKNFEAEIRALHKNGNYIWILDKGAVTERDSKGKPLRISGTHLDITNRVNIENNLHLAEQKFRDLVNSTDGIVWEADAVTLQILYASENAERLLGYTFSEIKLDNFWVNHIYPQDKDNVLNFYKTNIKNKKDFECEYRFHSKDNKIIWLRDIVKVVEDENEPIRIRGLLTDITQIKQSQQILDLREKSLGAISQGVILTDIDKKITYYNQAFEQITGYGNSIIGQTCAFLQGEDTDLETVKSIHLALEKMNTIQTEILNYRKNGEKFWNQLSISPVFDSEGNLIQYVGVQKDITEEKNRRLELTKAKEQAEEANKAKSEFITNMSHELRTPLNAVLGFSDLLMNAKLNNTQKHYMRIVYKSAKSLLDLLNDILDFSKLDDDKINLVFEKIDLKTLIKEVSEVIAFSLMEKKIQILIDMDDKLPNYIITDALRLRQILVNLLSNAVKFTQTGFIRISVKVIELNDLNNEVSLMFSVIDTGIGISSENLLKIFNAFWQVDASTSRKYGGTGLGLSISHKLLLLFGSKLEVKSEINKGSEFYFTITSKFGKSQETTNKKNLLKEEPTISNSISTINKYRILTVDDDSINLFLMRTLIHDVLPSAKIVEAINGKEAIAKCNEEIPDMIFMDVQMPEMNGYEATVEIRKLTPERHIPIIAITAGIRQIDKEKCFEIGMDDFASKPIVKGSIEKFIKKWLIEKEAI